MLGLISDLAKNVEVKYPDEPFTTCFAVIDNDKVVISIINPVEQKDLLSMTKTWDQRLAARLRTEFEEMWKSARNSTNSGYLTFVIPYLLVSQQCTHHLI